uniref:Uncharacterized protein n=1 Tax=Solanum tuberosum TaxID=4113 RepID=M1B1A4_SOLTU
MTALLYGLEQSFRLDFGDYALGYDPYRAVIKNINDQKPFLLLMEKMLLLFL